MGTLTLVGSGHSSSSKVIEEPLIWWVPLPWWVVEPLPWWVVDTCPVVRLWRSLTLVGSGHSSSSKVITAGPSGSSIGMTCMRECTTASHPDSLSATLCNVNIDRGGSCSLQGKRFKYSITVPNYKGT